MQAFNKHDLSEPRYRKEQYEVVNKQFLADARAKFSKLKDMGDREIAGIIKAFNEAICNEIIETRDGIELPESLGYLIIVACQPKNTEMVDYAKSKKYGVKVLHKNWDTDGRLGKIVYSNASARYKVRDREIWGFSPTRVFSRKVSQEFRKNWMNYIEITSDEWVSKLIDRQNRRKEVQKNYMQRVVKTYNEFEE